MNKKFIFGMFAATAAVFATSCSNDELDVIETGTDAQVTFAVGLEGNMGSRAISDGTGAKKLIYAVYNSEDKLITTIANADANGQVVNNEAFATGLTETVTISLAKGQQYTVVFWAQNPACNAYGTDNLESITVNYTGNNNDEIRDAFYKAETFTVTENAEINVTLKRPFAQINVGVTKADWDAAVASGIDIAKSKVVINKVSNVINLLSGEVDGNTSVAYDFATIPAKFTPAETLKVDLNKDSEYTDDEVFTYLSMSYILAGKESSTVEDVQFVFNPAAGQDIVFKKGLASVPVQRNWRTNILGQILTGNIQFNIVIDPAYISDYNYPDYEADVVSVGTADELKDALEAGKKVLMVKDIVMPENTVITIANGKESSLDLNGLTLSATNTAKLTHNDFILVKGVLNIQNGTITYKHTGESLGWSGCTNLLDITAGGVVNMTDVVAQNLGGTDMNFAVHMNNWGEVTLNADKCEFLAPYCGVRVFNSGPDMNNVTISNSKITGSTRAFWVHNYVGDGTASDKTLNIRIFNRNNIFEVTENVTSPVRYGFSNPVFYVIDGDAIFAQGKNAVTYYGYYGDDTEVTVPAEINGIPVTETGKSAFAYTSVEKVILPASLVTLGGYTFQECASLTSVELPEGLQTIGDRAFRKCKSLEEITLPNSLTTIVESAFQQAGVKSITIPENVTYIGKMALGACSKVESITINAKNITIGHYCARACANLKSVIINSETVAFDEGSMYFTNKENADASGITFYVASQTVADALYGAMNPVSGYYGLKIVSLDGNTTYYNTLK